MPAFLLKNPLASILGIGAALASLAAVVLFGLWQWEKADFAGYKLAQEKAVRKAQERADALSTDLLIEQAKAYAVTEKTVVEYRDRIRAAPDENAKNTLGTQAVKDILGGGK